MVALHAEHGGVKTAGLATDGATVSEVLVGVVVVVVNVNDLDVLGVVRVVVGGLLLVGLGVGLLLGGVAHAGLVVGDVVGVHLVGSVVSLLLVHG